MQVYIFRLEESSINDWLTANEIKREEVIDISVIPGDDSAHPQYVLTCEFKDEV